MYQNGLGYIFDTYPNPYPPVTVHPPHDYSRLVEMFVPFECTLHSEIIAREMFFEELFSEELREIVAIDCGKYFFENYLRAIARTCCGSVFSCCVHRCLGQAALKSWG